MPRRSVHLIVLALALPGIFLRPASGPAAEPAPPPITNWKWPIERYPPPDQSQVKTLISGQQADRIGNNLFDVKLPSIQTFRLGNVLEMTMEAPQCVFDVRAGSASSANRLQIRSADGRLRIEGTGFLWQHSETNSTLALSNEVDTVFSRELLSTNGSAANPPGATNLPVRVQSDSLFSDGNANRITYRGHVHVEDEEMELFCDLLTIQRTEPPGSTIESIVAEQNVAIVSRATGGRATGDHAVYAATSDGAQLITLTGHPRYAQAQNGPIEGTADAFVFDRTRHLFREIGNAFLKLPANSVTNFGAILTPPASAASSATDTGAAFISVYSSVMTFQFPATNGPVQSITAETNVMILDPKDASRASADTAFFAQTNGIMELTGHALWQSDQGLSRGDVLRFDARNQAFTAQGNAFLRLPITNLGPSVASTGPAAGGTNQLTNSFLEIAAGSYDYLGNRLTFHPPIRAGVVQGETIVGTLDCSRSLTVDFVGNDPREITAESDVHVRQLPALDASGQSTERELLTTTLLVHLGANRLVREIVARGNVLATQTKTPANNAKPQVLTLTSENLDAVFLPGTNLLDHVTAENHVIVTREDATGWGDRLVYATSNHLATLTGNARVQATNLVTTAPGGITYETTTGTLRTIGPQQTMIAVHALVKTNHPPPPP